MNTERWGGLLRRVAAGRLSPERALAALADLPFEDLGFAKPDHHRALRQGFPEVVFGPGKTPAQITRIVRSLSRRNGPVLVTRVGPAVARALRAAGLRARYRRRAACAVIGSGPTKPAGLVVVATAGTADIPVAEEAALTARLFGARVVGVYDVGVAGLHRLLAHRELMTRARCVVVAAGMDGALASVVGGLVPCPVVAVPTSVGYGSSFEGLSALLTMLNACAPNVAVVNIDNGFGAGYYAGLVNRLGAAPAPRR